MINTKLDLIKQLSHDMMRQSANYNGIFFWCHNSPCMKSYINNYYSNFRDILKDVKIWLDMILKDSRYYLEYARYNILYDANKYNYDDSKKEARKIIINAYKQWLNTLLKDGVNFKSNHMYIDGFNKYINNQEILSIICGDDNLNELLKVLSFSSVMINSNINVVIDKFEMLNKYLIGQNDIEIKKQFVADIHTEFFTALRNSIDKSDVDNMFDLKEKTNNAEDIYEIVKSYEKQQDNSIDNE